jgi:hypothetical protein
MRLHTGWVVGVLPFGVFAAQPALAQAVVADFPIGPMGTNPCTNEAVVTTGHTLVIIHPSTDGAGGFHITFRILSQGNGSTTDLLKKYVARNDQLFEVNVPAGGGSDQTFLVSVAWIRQGESVSGAVALGGGDDFMSKEQIHLTITPAGVPTASVNNFSTRCM